MDAAADSPAALIAVVAGFFLFAGGFWAIVCLGQWALGAANDASIGKPLPMQFSVCEFLLLLLQAQLVATGGLWWCDGEATLAAAGVAVGCGAVVALWWVSLRRLARCRVACPAKRTVFLLLVAPATCAAFIAAMWINGRAAVDLLTAGAFQDVPWLIGNLVTIVTFLACRGLTAWVLHASGRSAAGARAGA